MTEHGPNYLAYDIETVANSKARDYYAQKKYEAPSNYKDQEKIEKYILEKRHEDEKKAALSWWTGQIVCINVRSILKGTSKTFVGAKEDKIIEAFFAYLEGEGRFVLTGKSSEYFDKPYIVGRALSLDLGLPQCLRPYRPLEDVDQIFGFGSRADQASTLDNYAFGLGLKKKSGHGTDVQHWFNAATTGQDVEGFKKIAAYCADDVNIVAEMIRRWAKPWVNPATKDSTKAIEDAEVPFGAPAPKPETELVKASKEAFEKLTPQPSLDVPVHQDPFTAMEFE